MGFYASIICTSNIILAGDYSIMHEIIMDVSSPQQMIMVLGNNYSMIPEAFSIQTKTRSRDIGLGGSQFIIVNSIINLEASIKLIIWRKLFREVYRDFNTSLDFSKGLFNSLRQVGYLFSYTLLFNYFNLNLLNS